ncbi:hypothetical protein HDU98_006970 [Podochytrium sp. JEL0797]|nr:hypothetical protein HDU98_006970 [Podochytrium sp. JEL0797]
MGPPSRSRQGKPAKASSRALDSITSDPPSSDIEMHTESAGHQTDRDEDHNESMDLDDEDNEDNEDLEDDDEEDEQEDEWADQLLSAKPKSQSNQTQQNVPTIEKEEAEGDDEEEEGEAEKEARRQANQAEMQRAMELSEVQSILSSENVEVIAQGLSRLNYRLKRLARGIVDHEVSEEADLMLSYFKSSPDAVEVLNLWYFQQKHEIQRLDIPIMETLAYLITASRLLGSRAVGTSVAKTIIRGHMKQLYRNLSSKKHALMQVTMRLLAAMVVHNTSCARELFGGFNFSLKALPFMFKVKKATDQGKMDDVRGLYIRFLLGFVMYGDANVKRGILETKDTISLIFKGMQEDHYLTVDFIFTVLKKKLIDDPQLNRQTKQSFFNNYVLELITKLCSRTDTDDPNNCSEPDPADGTVKTVADLTHDFLIHLCTRPGHGICVQEPGWLQVKKSFATGGDVAETGVATTTVKFLKQRNGHLLKWSSFLKPTEYPLEMAVLLELLKNCPELVHPYWTQVSLSFEPRLSSRWITNMALAANIITLPVPSLLASAQHTHTDPTTVLAPPTLQTLADNVLPSALTRIAMGRALQHASPTVRHVAAFVVSRALEKLGLVLEEIERVRVRVAETGVEGESGGEKAGEEWRALKEALVEEVRRRVPEVQTVLSLLMKASDSGVGAAVAQKGKKGKGKQMQVDEEEEESGEVVGVVGEAADMEEDVTVTPVVLQCASMRLVREYQKHFPDQMAESKFDYGKLVPMDFPSSAVEIQQAVLEFLLEVPNFKWWLNPAGSQNSHLQTLLKMYCYSEAKAIRELSQQVVTHFLASAYIFGNNVDEIALWLDAVSMFTKLSLGQNAPSVISWFDSACCSTVKNPPKFIDRMSRLVEYVSASLDPLSQRIVAHVYENRTMAVSHSKQSSLTEEEDDMETDLHAFRSVFPFSPVVIAALDGIASLIKSLQKEPAAGSAVSTKERADQILNIVRCFCVVGLDILAYTQGTREFLNKLVKDVYDVVVADSGKEVFKADEAVSFLMLLVSGIEGVVPKVGGGVELPEIADGCDFSAVISGILACDQSKQTAALARLIGLSETSESAKSSVSVATRLIPALGRSTLASGFDNLLPTSLLPNLFVLLESASLNLDAATKANLTEVLVAGSLSRIACVSGLLSWAAIHTSALTQPVVDFLSACLTAVMVASHGDDDASDEWSRLRHFVFRHPVLVAAFLKPKNPLAAVSLHLIKTFLSLDYSASTSTIYDEYVCQVRDHLLYELSPTSKYLISAPVVNSFDIVRSFMTESDLNRILEAVLVIPVVNNAAQLFIQNRLISCILTVDTQAASTSSSTQNKYRQITSQAFSRLLKLLQDCPSQELDQIFESCVLSSASEASLKSGRALFRVTAPMRLGTSRSDCHIFAHVPSLIDLETVAALIKRPNPARLNAVKHLVALSPMIRGWVLAEGGGAGLKGNVAKAVFEGCLMGLTIVDGEAGVDWSPAATAVEKGQVVQLGHAADGFIDKLVDRVLNGTGVPSEGSGVEGSLAMRIIGMELFGSASEGFFGKLVQDMLDKTEFVDVKGSLMWLNEYFDALVLAERMAVDQRGALDVTVFSAILKIVRLYLQGRKRVEVPVSAESSEFRAEQCASKLLDKVQKYWSLPANVASVLANGFAVGSGMDVLRDFFKTTLKYRLNDPRVLQFLTELAGILYVNQDSHPIPLEQLFQMIGGHSQFKTILRPATVATSSPNANVKKLYTFHPCKLALIKLIQVLVNNSSNQLITEVRSTIIPAISISYMGSQNESDRAILSLWEFYESKHGLSIASNVVHWSQIISMEDGDAASLVAAGGATGTVSPAAAADALTHIDPVLMIQTIAGFSISNDLHGSAITHKGLDQGMYDPSFFLPLIANAIKLGGERLDTKLLAESNALGLAVMALSSDVEDVRKAAYFILDMAYAHLYKVERLQQKLQLTLLLTMLKNGITERTATVFPQIPSIIALFFSQAMSIVSKPEHFMYPLVNSFLLSRPTVDFEDVPMFYVLFNSSTDTCRRERTWLYRLLCSGLKRDEDYRLYKRRHVFDLVTSFFHFPLADITVRKLTFELILNAASIPSVLVDLITERGLLTFLTTISTNMNIHPQNELASSLPRLLIQISKTWFESCSQTATEDASSTAPPHRRNLALSNTLHTCALTQLKNVQYGFKQFIASSKTGEASPEAAMPSYVWWVTVLQDTIRFMKIVVQGCRAMEGEVAGLGVAEVAELIGFVEEVKSQSSLFMRREASSVQEEDVHMTLVESLFASAASSGSVGTKFERVEVDLFTIVSNSSCCILPRRIELSADKKQMFVLKSTRVVKWVCDVAQSKMEAELYAMVVPWIAQVESSSLLEVMVERLEGPASGLVLSAVLDVLIAVLQKRELQVEAIRILANMCVKLVGSTDQEVVGRKHGASSTESLQSVFVEFVVSRMSLDSKDLEDSSPIAMDALVNVLIKVWGGRGAGDESASMRTAWVNRLGAVLKEMGSGGVWNQELTALVQDIRGAASGVSQQSKKTRLG